jgi:ABC-type branched-subunit amino acid transport system ATPase component
MEITVHGVSCVADISWAPTSSGAGTNAGNDGVHPVLPSLGSTNGELEKLSSKGSNSSWTDNGLSADSGSRTARGKHAADRDQFLQRQPNYPQSSYLLQNINLSIKPGTVTTFFGVGNGYAALLECISLTRTASTRIVGGDVQYDRSRRKSGAYKDIVYLCETGASHFDSLSVCEYLYYCARLRTAHDSAECHERARMACRVVGLDSVALIANLTKTDVCLLTIAGELVGSPSTLCIKHPTKDLDAAGAVEVFYALHKVSKRISSPTTVVCCGTLSWSPAHLH